MTDAEKIVALEARVARLEAFAMALQQAVGGKSGGSDVASDRDLDGQYGDEEVRFNPRDWSGAPIKGKRMSRCDPDALDLLAEACDYFAQKNEAAGAKTSSGKPKAQYDRTSAARARGWAKRLRAGWKPPEREPDSFDNQGPDPFDSSEPAFGGFPDDEAPF